MPGRPHEHRIAIDIALARFPEAFVCLPADLAGCGEVASINRFLGSDEKFAGLFCGTGNGILLMQ
jgi:hypothetical protein